MFTSNRRIRNINHGLALKHSQQNKSLGASSICQYVLSRSSTTNQNNQTQDKVDEGELQHSEPKWLGEVMQMTGIHHYVSR